MLLAAPPRFVTVMPKGTQSFTSTGSPGPRTDKPRLAGVTTAELVTIVTTLLAPVTNWPGAAITKELVRLPTTVGVVVMVAVAPAPGGTMPRLTTTSSVLEVVLVVAPPGLEPTNCTDTGIVFVMKTFAGARRKLETVIVWTKGLFVK